jgi:hypothetical protein
LPTAWPAPASGQFRCRFSALPNGDRIFPKSAPHPHASRASRKCRHRGSRVADSWEFTDDQSSYPPLLIQARIICSPPCLQRNARTCFPTWNWSRCRWANRFANPACRCATSISLPATCIVSLLYVMEDGASAEIAVVGRGYRRHLRDKESGLDSCPLPSRARIKT